MKIHFLALAFLLAVALADLQCLSGATHPLLKDLTEVNPFYDLKSQLSGSSIEGPVNNVCPNLTGVQQCCSEAFYAAMDPVVTAILSNLSVDVTDLTAPIKQAISELSDTKKATCNSLVVKLAGISSFCNKMLGALIDQYKAQLALFEAATEITVRVGKQAANYGIGLTCGVCSGTTFWEEKDGVLYIVMDEVARDLFSAPFEFLFDALIAYIDSLENLLTHGMAAAFAAMPGSEDFDVSEFTADFAGAFDEMKVAFSMANFSDTFKDILVGYQIANPFNLLTTQAFSTFSGFMSDVPFIDMIQGANNAPLLVPPPLLPEISLMAVNSQSKNLYGNSESQSAGVSVQSYPVGETSKSSGLYEEDEPFPKNTGGNFPFLIVIIVIICVCCAAVSLILHFRARNASTSHSGTIRNPLTDYA